MPLYKRWTEGKAEWGIWKVTETDDELLSCLSESFPYAEELEQFKSPVRRTEYLSVRVLLKVLLGKEYRICYYPSGKPYLSDIGLHITISHTCGYVSVGLGHDSKRETNSAYTDGYIRADLAAVLQDPVIRSMTREQVEKAVVTARKNMQKAAADLDFMAAAKYRDEMWALQEYLKVWTSAAK